MAPLEPEFHGGSNGGGFGASRGRLETGKNKTVGREGARAETTIDSEMAWPLPGKGIFVPRPHS